MRVGWIGLIALLLVLAACDGDEEDPADLDIEVNAEVLEADAPVTIEVTDLLDGDEGTIEHGVSVRWDGDEAAQLDDARFSHHITEGDGDLVIAGRGCDAHWDDELDLMLACTDDLQIVRVDPGEAHEYPVTLYPEVGPLSLAPGTYVVEERIAWNHGDDPDAPAASEEGAFTVRLTYDVR